MQETPRANDLLDERVCEMFDFSHFVGNSTYRNMVYIRYLNLDLSHLPPSKRNLDEFLVET